MTDTRIETDSLGDVEVPADALYGAQTQRAIDNFPISGRPMPRPFIAALIAVKRAAARANLALGQTDADLARAIDEACGELLAMDYMAHFPIDVFQTGSGTSTNMNANEVIATLASRRLDREVHPNDDVNRSQSSNDVIPTTLQASCALELRGALLPALEHLAIAIDRRAGDIGDQVKTGRTHLMDAMPVTFGQVLGGWSTQVRAAAARLEAGHAEMLKLPQGGTAVGTGVNAPAGFAAGFCNQLGELTGQRFEPADTPFAIMGGQDGSAMLSGALRGAAVVLMKIANDLRWMNSGPLAGLGEIELKALQPGSSIMPGKVNPVIPEAVAMVCAEVMGNDVTVGIAAQSGNFELNVMLPVIAANLLDSIALLANAANRLADSAIATFVVKPERIGEALNRNPILVTALNSIIGYQKAAAIAKQAYAEGRPILDVARERTDIGREELERLLDPALLTRGG